MHRIDVHQHLIPPTYRALLAAHGIGEAGGRALPEWSPDSALTVMDRAGIATAILSVSTPGTTFLTDRDEAAALARELNEYAAAVSAEHPGRFGYFATLPTPDFPAAAHEAQYALDHLHADGVVLLANSAGVYLGDSGQEALFEALDERSAVAFIHPAELPSAAVPGIPPFAADFLLDTTRAAYLLVSNGIRRRYPNIRFILSHAGGFVPYASHRMAVSIADASARSVLDVLDDFSGFYFDTALSSSRVALPSLLAFADPGHVLFGTDWPFAPERAGQYFEAGLDTYTQREPVLQRQIDRENALGLFPRLGSIGPTARPSVANRIRGAAMRSAMRGITRLIGSA